LQIIVIVREDGIRYLHAIAVCGPTPVIFDGHMVIANGKIVNMGLASTIFANQNFR
jgi:hypothetical protein